MPTVIVNRDHLFKYIGETYSDERFDEICFEFGIELDEITSEKEMFENEQKKSKEGLSTEVLYKIEVPANRYDLLCLEGLGMALRVFLNKSDIPEIKVLNSSDSVHSLTVEESVVKVRPYVLAAILRDITFTDESLISFMELQDKLHHNICRGRSLVSMGTHDLDSVKAPFFYRGLQRDSFKFLPLNRNDEVTGSELLEILKNDHKLKHFVPLLANEDYFPAIVDSNGLIMSVPPMLNSEPSKLKISTKNVFIEVTAKDKTKANVVLNTLIAMFSVYCKNPFTVEEVKVITHTGKTIVYPQIQPRVFKTNINYLNQIAGTELSSEEITKLLLRMGLKSLLESENKDTLTVQAPIMRSDIIHACDIAEDLAISYGYNNISKKKLTTVCNGAQQPINKLTDLIRTEMAMSGYTECLTMALLSKKDLFTNVLKPFSEFEVSRTVEIFKSKCPEFEVFRTTLIPGLLKTIEANKANQLPYKLFEISDVVLVDSESENRAVNKRRLCFAYCNTTSGLEILQGAVDHLMIKLGVPYNDKQNGYYIEPSFSPTFFEDRQAFLFVKGVKVGIFGIVHPLVLKNFNIKIPVSLAEIDIEFIFDLVIKGELLKGY